MKPKNNIAKNVEHPKLKGNTCFQEMSQKYIAEVAFQLLSDLQLGISMARQSHFQLYRKENVSDKSEFNYLI